MANMKKSKRPKRKPFPNIPKGIFDHENWGGDNIRNMGNKTFLVIVFSIILAVTFGAVAVVVLTAFDNRFIENKCLTLENQSKEFERFFITHDDKILCDRHGFGFAGSRNAPVHTSTMPNGGDGYLEAGVWYTNGLGKWKLETSESGFIN